MKRLTEFINETQKQLLKATKNGLTAYTKADIEKYLEIADKFLTDEVKNICRYLIDNPDYAEKLGYPNSENALVDFYNAGKPSEENKELYRWISEAIKNHQLYGIPTFQTDEEFKSILNKTLSPDEVIIDIDSDEGRNEVAKRFDPLVWKIARGYMGKSGIDLAGLHSLGLLGLTNAMNMYGSKSAKNSEATKSTFIQYAGQMIRNAILDGIKGASWTGEGGAHLVRVPISQQNKERKERGSNTVNREISLETPLAPNKDGNSKTLQDKIGDYTRAEKEMDYEDIDNRWKALEPKFKKFIEDALPKKKDAYDIFCDYFGLFGHLKKATDTNANGDVYKPGEIQKKYGLKNQSEINQIVYNVIKKLKADKEMMNLFTEIYELTTECKHDDDMEERDFNPVYISDFSNND